MSETNGNDEIIRVINLVKRHGKLHVLNGIDMTVRRGEVAVLVGPSGGGKSTLLRCLNGLENFQGGEVRVGDFTLTPSRRPYPANSLRPMRQKLGMVFQQFHLFPHMTVLENVMLAPRLVQGRSEEAVRPEAIELLRRVGLADKHDYWPSDLSGGQQQRVAIARALAVKPEAILFDEPTSALDPHMANEVLAVMTDLAKAGQTMIVVTHAMGFARMVATTVHVMAAGKIAESGSPQQVFTNPREQVTREFLAEADSGIREPVAAVQTAP